MEDAHPAPVLDVDALRAVSGGDRELMVELAQLYVDDSRQQLAALESAVVASDLEEVGSVAHGLKGSSASVGCSEAAGAFKVLEELGRTATADGVPEALTEAKAAFVRAVEALTQIT